MREAVDCCSSDSACPFSYCVQALSKLVKVSKTSKVYCSLATNVELTDHFFEAKSLGASGGCEAPFVSASKDKDAVLNAAMMRAQCASGVSGTPTCPVVLEVTPKLVDRPAELSWLSQYPGEQDTVFPALTGIETMGYRVDDIKGGAVLVIETTPIVNRVTFDEVETRKKRLVTSTRDALISSIEEAFSRVDDCQLPFKVEVSGAGLHTLNGLYTLYLHAEAGQGGNQKENILPRWVQDQHGGAAHILPPNATFPKWRLSGYSTSHGCTSKTVPLDAEWEVRIDWRD